MHDGCAGVVGCRDHLQQGAVECDWLGGGKKYFLKQTFLGKALVGPVLLLGLGYLFHQIAFTVTVQPGLRAVYAQATGYVFLVCRKTREHK